MFDGDGILLYTLRFVYDHLHFIYIFSSIQVQEYFLQFRNKFRRGVKKSEIDVRAKALLLLYYILVSTFDYFLDAYVFLSRHRGSKNETLDNQMVVI